MVYNTMNRPVCVIFNIMSTALRYVNYKIAQFYMLKNYKWGYSLPKLGVSAITPNI